MGYKNIIIYFLNVTYIINDKWYNTHTAIIILLRDMLCKIIKLIIIKNYLDTETITEEIYANVTTIMSLTNLV